MSIGGGPARVLVLATIVVPGDQAMPLPELEAYIAQAFRDGGVLPVRVNCEFIELVSRGGVSPSGKEQP